MNDGDGVAVNALTHLRLPGCVSPCSADKKTPADIAGVAGERN
jgi:hypothetical protein